MHIDLEQVAALVAEADAASTKAAALVKPAHAKALQAAARLRDELAVTLSPDKRTRQLCALIEKAVGKRFKDASASRLELAGVVLGQYVAHLSSVSFRNITDANQRDGAFILRTFHNYSATLQPEQRLKVLDALVLAAQGELETGLIDFAGARDWPVLLTEEAADALAKLADPEAHAKYHANKQDLAQQYTSAQRYVDAMTQAEPALFRVDMGGASTVAIRNHRPGGIGFSNGTTLEGGTVTELDLVTFDKIRDSDYFQAHLKDGVLEITAPAKLAERI